jgi:hypothetical protein
MEISPITYEQVLALFAETDRKFAETDRKFVETDKKFVETDRKFVETDKKFVETSNKLDATGKYIEKIAKQVGEITDTLGRFAEEQVRPKILHLFRLKGIDLQDSISRFCIEKNGVFILEVDLLLVNTIYSVAVEVKTTLRQRDVDDHIERLEKLQESAHKIIKGTTLYGAIAGMIVNKEVEQYAIKKGLFVLKTKGDNVEISNKSDFMPMAWIVS